MAWPQAAWVAYSSLASAQASTSVGLFCSRTVMAVMASGMRPRLLRTATRRFRTLMLVGSSRRILSYPSNTCSSCSGVCATDSL